MVLTKKQSIGFSIIEAMISAVILAVIVLYGTKSYQSSLASSAELALTQDSIDLSSNIITIIRANVSQSIKPNPASPISDVDFQNAVTAFATQVQGEINQASPTVPVFREWQKISRKEVNITVDAYDSQRAGVPIHVTIHWLGTKDSKSSKSTLTIDSLIAKRVTAI